MRPSLTSPNSSFACWKLDSQLSRNSLRAVRLTVSRTSQNCLMKASRW